MFPFLSAMWSKFMGKFKGVTLQTKNLYTGGLNSKKSKTENIVTKGEITGITESKYDEDIDFKTS